MAKEKNFDIPIGWLMDPHNKWAIHFDYKKLPGENNVDDFTIDMWGVVPGGKPMTFKSRRKATKQDSLKTWNQLIASNWVEIDFEKIMIA
tara:strand:+ start:1229 stop:1498 length:270 start_codon:yes stop_codon:yes gene_type:complete